MTRMPTTKTFGEVRKGVFPNLQRDPLADEFTEPFWNAAMDDRLVAPQCTRCGTFRLPPLPLCHVCQSEEFDWTELPGTGTVYSYTVVHHPLHPDLAPVCPYVSGVVELDGTQGEGARLLVNIIDCDPEQISIGTRVRVVFDHVEDEMPTPRCRPLPG
jgi:uncharacterized OB-fold protein